MNDPSDTCNTITFSNDIVSCWLFWNFPLTFSRHCPRKHICIYYRAKTLVIKTSSNIISFLWTLYISFSQCCCKSQVQRFSLSFPLLTYCLVHNTYASYAHINQNQTLDKRMWFDIKFSQPIFSISPVILVKPFYHLSITDLAS